MGTARDLRNAVWPMAISPQKPGTVYAVGHNFNGLGSFSFQELGISAADPDTMHLCTSRGVFSFTRAGSSSGPDAPVIDSLSSLSAKLGDNITIAGKNFGSSQGSSKVLFGSEDAGTADVWADNEIQIEVPSGAGTGPLKVQVNSERSNSIEFVVLPPEGQNLFPAAGKVGSEIAIVAPDFVSQQFNVFFGDVVVAPPRPVEPGIFLCTVPPGSGTVEVSLSRNAALVRIGTFTYE